jgi:hypothetical protein
MKSNFFLLNQFRWLDIVEDIVSFSKNTSLNEKSNEKAVGLGVGVVNRMS